MTEICGWNSPWNHWGGHGPLRLTFTGPVYILLNRFFEEENYNTSFLKLYEDQRNVDNYGRGIELSLYVINCPYHGLPWIYNRMYLLSDLEFKNHRRTVREVTIGVSIFYGWRDL